MGIDAFRDLAHSTTLDAIGQCEQGNYITSWTESLIARVQYAADAVVNTAEIPFSCAQTFIGAIATVFTWGNSPRTIQICADGLDGCAERFNRIFKGIFGSFISTSMAYNMRDVNMVPVALSVLSLAAFVKYAPRPNLVYFDTFTGHWSFGWDLRR